MVYGTNSACCPLVAQSFYVSGAIVPLVGGTYSAGPFWFLKHESDPRLRYNLILRSAVAVLIFASRNFDKSFLSSAHYLVITSSIVKRNVLLLPEFYLDTAVYLDKFCWSMYIFPPFFLFRFDDAQAVYTQLLNEDPTNTVSRWYLRALRVFVNRFIYPQVDHTRLSYSWSHPSLSFVPHLTVWNVTRHNRIRPYGLVLFLNHISFTPVMCQHVAVHHASMPWIFKPGLSA